MVVCYSVIFSAFGQETQSNYSIKGIVADSISKSSIDYLTVSLETVQSVPVKSILTKENGNFLFEKLATGKYIITIIGVAYQSKTISIDLTDNTNQLIDLGTIIMIAQSSQLKEVVVTASRPIIKQEIDRITYDMRADPDSKNNNLLDMMRKVPLLSLDGEDNILLKGGSNYKILINGRPSSMVALSPRDILRSMPASSILRIEVITTPSAKYDAEGLAGIINIITDKKTDQKYKGSIGTYCNTLLGKGFWGNATAKIGELGVSGSFARYFRHLPASASNSYRVGIEPIQSLLREEGINHNSGNIIGGNIELSYDIDSLNSLTGYITFNENSNNQNRDRFFGIFDQDNSLSQSYRLYNNEESRAKGTDIGINYQLGFKKNKDRFLTVSYNYNSSNNNQNTYNLISDRFNYINDDLGQKNKSGSQEQTVQLDYTQTVKKVSIEGGVKAIMRDHYSDFISESFDTNGQLKPGSTVADQFDYLQTVYALYNSYSRAWKNWGVKAGVRLELTDIDANFIKTDRTWKQSYINFIPSAIIQRKMETSSVNLGYTQRIQRPGIMQLNPFLNKSNPLIYTSGNPDLLPVFTHNFELSYRRFKKGFINFSLDYSFADNTIQNVLELGADSISRSSFENIGKTDNLGVNINVNYPVTNKFNINFNGRASYLWIEGMSDGKMYSNEGFQGNVSAIFSYAINENFRTSLGLFGNGPTMNLQGNTNANFFNMFATTKSFFEKKASVTLQIYNPFQKYRHAIDRINTLGFIQNSDIRLVVRGIYANFIYNFGSLKEGIKKSKRGINNDDIEKPKE